MSSLLALLSPAKLIDDQTHYPNIPCSTPQFIDEAHYLVKKLRSLSPEQLTQILDISSKLAQETQQRHMNWQTPFSHQNAHPAIMMFQGEVYRGLKANELNSKQLQYANKHIKILSGLYGILRPLDWAMPYRLMMGTRFEVDSKTPKKRALPMRLSAPMQSSQEVLWLGFSLTTPLKMCPTSRHSIMKTISLINTYPTNRYLFSLDSIF